jgi:hypothetical protein
MPGSSSNSSFIPKRGTSKHKRRVRSGNIYVFTIISYVLIFTALISSGAVFFYASVVKGELQDEIAAMNAAVNQFNQADLLRVQEFDGRLAQVQDRLSNTGSIVAIFDAIEAATIGTVRFAGFKLERNFDTNYIIDAQLDTDTFDSAIFQRTIAGGNEVVTEVEFTDVSLTTSVIEDTALVGQSLRISALLMVPIEAVPLQITAPEVTPPTVSVPETVATSSPETTTGDDSEDGDFETIIEGGV